MCNSDCISQIRICEKHNCCTFRSTSPAKRPGCDGYSSQFHAESDAGRLYIEQIRDEWCSTLHSDASRASRTYAVIRVAHRLYRIYPTVSLRPCAPRFLTKEATCAGQSLYSA